MRKSHVLMCWELVCLQRGRRGLLVRQSCGGSTDLWNSELWAVFFIKCTWLSCWLSFQAPPWKAQASLAKLRKNGVISLWAIIVWNRLRSTLALASRQQLQTDNSSQTRIAEQRERTQRLVFIYLYSQSCVCVYRCGVGISPQRKQENDWKEYREKWQFGE